MIWLEPRVLARLRGLRGPGESYSDVILRLAGSGSRARSKPNRAPKTDLISSEI